MPIKYKNDLVLKIHSKDEKYSYHYSVDGGNTFEIFSITAANLVLCRGYIGTNLGIYATSNGYKTKEYAEFNWVKNHIE
jgi:alpha-N-arabinofuranosidase